jgi:hypothetical protein
MKHIGLLAVAFLVFPWLTEPLNAAQPENFNLGPTGLQGVSAGSSITVTGVEKGSPADGKIAKGDQLLGTGRGKFGKNPRRDLADAIDAAESAEGAGKLVVLLKGGRKVELPLEVLGSYSDTAPYDCPKSKAIITRTAEYLARAGKSEDGKLLTRLLGLMATGEEKYIAVAAEAIRTADWAKPDAAKIDQLLKGDIDMGSVGWYWGYYLVTLSEYYLLTQDKSVLPAIRTYALGLSRGQDAAGLWGHRMATTTRNGRLPGYAQMNQSSLSNFMGLLLAWKCGVHDDVLKQAIARTSAFYVTFIGRGTLPYGVHEPKDSLFNNNGMSGSAALCMALAGNAEGARFFSQQAATSFDGLEIGHASTFFNPLWTPLGSALSGRDVTREFFKRSRWFWTIYRTWDGGASRFGGKQNEGSQAGVALLMYCLPRRALYITGKNADESLWVKGDAALTVVNRSQVNYEAKSADELIALFGDPVPQVTRAAIWALNKKGGDHGERLRKLLREGSDREKISCLRYFGSQPPPGQQKAVMEDAGKLLRDRSASAEVRAAAADILAGMGEMAYPYYADMVALVGEERADDPFGLIDNQVGSSLNGLCGEPFKAGLVKDKAAHYRAAIKLARNKRQNARGEGLKMLKGLPLEDFPIVADTVIHVLDDKDPTYHSYHNPGAASVPGVAILADLKIREGLDYAMNIQDLDGGKGSFKMRAVMAALAQYGANARPLLEKLKADSGWKDVPQNKKLSREWNRMVKAVEEDKTPAPLITLKAARQGKRE